MSDELSPAKVRLTDGLGPWEPERDTGYAAKKKPWTLRRLNPRFKWGWETMGTVTTGVCRWVSEEAAKKSADKLNGPNDQG